MTEAKKKANALMKLFLGHTDKFTGGKEIHSIVFVKEIVLAHIDLLSQFGRLNCRPPSLRNQLDFLAEVKKEVINYKDNRRENNY